MCQADPGSTAQNKGVNMAYYNSAWLPYAWFQCLVRFTMQSNKTSGGSCHELWPSSIENTCLSHTTAEPERHIALIASMSSPCCCPHRANRAELKPRETR